MHEYIYPIDTKKTRWDAPGYPMPDMSVQMIGAQSIDVNPIQGKIRLLCHKTRIMRDIDFKSLSGASNLTDREIGLVVIETAKTFLNWTTVFQTPETEDNLRDLFQLIVEDFGELI